MFISPTSFIKLNLVSSEPIFPSKFQPDHRNSQCYKMIEKKNYEIKCYIFKILSRKSESMTGPQTNDGN